jgi:hypothetical protein
MTDLDRRRPSPPTTPLQLHGHKWACLLDTVDRLKLWENTIVQSSATMLASDDHLGLWKDDRIERLPLPLIFGPGMRWALPVRGWWNSSTSIRRSPSYPVYLPDPPTNQHVHLHVRAAEEGGLDGRG